MKIVAEKTYDVFVAGAGVAGAAAALQAARMGKKVAIAEKCAALGGMATTGHVNLFEPMCNGRGKQIMKGMACETLDKFLAFGFNTIAIDGHDFDAIEKALKTAKKTKGQPTAIVMSTTKGKGVSFMENNAGWHGKSTNPAEFEVAMTELKAALAELEG